MAGELRRVGVIELRLDDSKLRPVQVDVQQQVERTTSSFNGLRGVMAAIGGVAAVHLAAGMIRSAAATEDAAGAFASLTRDADGATATLDALRQATGGAVKDFDLLTAANTAMLQGLPRNAAAMSELAAAARVLGDATGKDTLEAFEILTSGIGRSNSRMLTTIGLVVDSDAAHKAYAQSLGIAAAQMDEGQRKASFYAAALEQVRAKSAELPAAADDAADKLGRLGAQFDRMKTGFGSIVGDLLISPSGTGESLVGEAFGVGAGALAGAKIGSLFGPGIGTAIGAGVGGLIGLITGSLSESRGVQITQNVQMDGAGRKELEILSRQTEEASRQIRNLERR